MRLSAQSRLGLIKSVKKKRKTVAQACREAGISRKSYYKWLKRYNQAPSNKRLEALSDREWKLKRHGKRVSTKIEKLVLETVAGNPRLGYEAIRKKVAEVSGRAISKHAIQNIFLRSGLKDFDSKKTLQEGKGRDKIAPQERYLIFEATVKEGRPITAVCGEFGISRKTYYKWYKRYQETEDLSLDTFENKQWRIEKHPRRVSEKIEDKIISLVIKAPELSSHKLARKVGIGNHGVQNVLARRGLNLYQYRLAFSQAHSKVPQVIISRFLDRVRLVLEQFIPSLAPAPPPLRAVLRSISSYGAVLGPLGQRLLKPFFISSFLAFLFSYGALFWVRLLGAQTPSTAIGLIFASIALLMGSFFFLYSFKYYITLALVLSFSQQEVNSNSSFVNRNGKKRGIISWILGLNGHRSRGTLSEPGAGPEGEEGRGAVGLTPNLEHVKLKRYPYISIHIPFYNEKNVVERSIKAATNFDYGGEYEVILCDDSTDETTEIIRKYQKSFGGLRTSRGDGYTLTECQIRPGVTLKHLHRTTRSGYKGGALRLALKLCDPRTEFISVFDADFVPYPDTLELFLKYFQVTAGSLDFAKDTKRLRYEDIKSKKKKNHSISQYPNISISNIAAVQGYQWHVLNKSENWITRGIRSEYAGSYVIERSGREIYGALKQISGAVYMIRRDVLEEVGWETSITEDFQLTLKLYEAGYKVVYTPYIQAPAECVSTLKRLIRQRMRWAEGHSNNIRRMFLRLLYGQWSMVNGQKRFTPSPLTLSEKLEFLYLSPYYLQAFFFLVGTISWLISETLFPARLPFWTQLWGWSLVLTNMLSLPLMNAVGLFLEESEEKDYSGLASFIALSYIIVPFQAYSSLKGFLKGEGPWFRTPKTGKITDVIARGKFYRFISGILPGRSRAVPAVARSTSLRAMVGKPAHAMAHTSLRGAEGDEAISMGLPRGVYTERSRSARNDHLAIQPFNNYLALSSANNQFNNFTIKTRKGRRWIGKLLVTTFLAISTTLVSFAPYIEVKDNFDVPSQGSGILVSPKNRQSYLPSLKQKISLIKEVHASDFEGGSETSNQESGISFRADEQPELLFHIPKKKQESGFLKNLLRNLSALFKVSAHQSETEVALFDYSGKKLEVDLQVLEEADDEFRVKIPHFSGIKPGKYSVELITNQGGEHATYKQDFTWGVLAINTNKSIYLSSEALAKEGLPPETAKLAMAVLDDEGNMVCNASLKLKVQNAKLGIEDQLSTEDPPSPEATEGHGGSIRVNPECLTKDFTRKPDYEAEYRVGEVGVYEMTLSALTPSGERTITDSFEVREWVPFDIERDAPTRIYPPEVYPMRFTIKANEDFRGEVIETVPESFEITQDSRFMIHDSRINWQVDWKKGETHELGYEFDAPDESPEFYLLGPLELKIKSDPFDYTQGYPERSRTDEKFKVGEGDVIFREARQWQIAVDALIDISGNVLGSYGGTFIGNPPCNGSTAVVSLRVNDGDESTTDCDDTTGYYLFSSVSVNAGDTVTIYLNSNSSQKANLVMVAGTSNITGAELCEETIVIRDEDDGTATIADMVDYDNSQNPVDMFYDAEISPSVTLETEDEFELHIWTGDTFAPGGNVTTIGWDGTLHIHDNAAFTGASTEYHTIGNYVTIDSGATLTAPPDGTIEVKGGWENDGTFTAGSSTVYFNQSFTQAIEGNLNGSSAFYKVTFSGGGTWYIFDPIKVSKANGTDTFEIQNGTVILGDGGGGNMEVNGKMVIGSSTGAATFQTYSPLSEGSTITIDINNNSSPADCLYCIIEVGTSTNTDPQGTFTLNKNATLRFNSYSSVQSGFSVLASGRLNINGSQDDTGIDTGTDDAALRETKICADEAWILDGHNGKHVMMTSGFAIGRIYAITDTLLADNDCASNQHDSIVRANTSSANDTNPTVTGASCSGTGDCIITTSISLISANDEGIGRHIHNITDDEYYLVVDSTEGGTTDTIVITSGEPDTFTNMGSGDDIEITDSIRSGDTFSIIDLAHVTAQAGTSCNDSENGFITLAGDSETFIQFAEVCDLGAEIADKNGIQTSGDIDNNDANEGVTIRYSYIHDMNRGFVSAGGKVSTRAVIEHNLFETSSLWLFDIRGKGMSIRNNRITGAGLDGIITGGSDNYGSVFEGNYIHNNYQAGIEQWDGAGNSIIKDNVVFANGMGFYTQTGIGGEHIFYGNKVFSNVLRGWRHDGGTNSLFVGNEVFAELVGHRIRNTSGAIMVANQFGVKGENTTTDIDFEDTTGASSITCYGCTLASSTEVPANDVSYTASYFASFKQDSAGATKIWGEYGFPDDITETPNNEGSKQFNYANNTYPDSFSPHVYAGDGTEDSSLAFAFSGGSLGGSNDYYLYRLACNNSSGCNDDSPSNDWDVFRDETDIGDATTGSQYTDSTTNVQFTVQDAGTDYSLGDTYSFFAWKNAGDTNTQKSITMMQTGDTLTVGTGETIELKAGSSDDQTLIQKDSGATSYSLGVTGTIDANYYKITGTDASGLNLGTGATVTDLDNGVFDDSGGGGASDTYITVVASILNSGAKTWTDMVFDEGTADSNVDYNITLSGVPTSCDYSWTFNSSGNIGGATNGEANDNETDVDCGGVGYILWIDQGITSVWTYQRKTFYDATDDNYWRFYYDGSEIDIFYNQTPWTSSWTPITSLAENVEDYSVWDDDTYVYIAYYDTWDIKVRRGTLNPTSITWGSEEVALNGLNASSTYKYSFISQDSSGYLWVISRHYNGTNYYMRAVRSTNAYDVSAWDTAHDLSSTSNTDTNNYGLIVPLASQDMYAIWIRGNLIEGRQWDNDAAGDEWDPDKTSNPDSIATGQSGMTANITATTDTSNNVHLAYIDSSNYVQYLKCSAVCSGTFAGSARLDTSAGNQFVTASVDTTTDYVYVMWISSGDSYYNYYSTSWQGETGTGWDEGTSPSDLTSNYADDDRIFAVWTSGSASPYTTHWGYIVIPERIWLFFGFGPLLPLVLRRKRGKRRF